MATRGAYTVIRLEPNDASDREYRVKSARDGHERVVREPDPPRTDRTRCSAERDLGRLSVVVSGASRHTPTEAS